MSAACFAWGSALATFLATGGVLLPVYVWARFAR